MSSCRVSQDAHQFFAEVGRGDHCANTNWYEGSANELGWQDHIHRYNNPAPALLGFDENIDEFCQVGWGWVDYGGAQHAQHCVDRGYNILALYGQHLPYNICRNLEWQVCAAQGKLPGQGNKDIVFAIPPRDLEPEGRRPLGKCNGYGGNLGGCPWTGYATDSIFFFEVSAVGNAHGS